MGIVIFFISIIVLMYFITEYVNTTRETKNKNQNLKNIKISDSDNAQGIVFGKVKKKSEKVAYSAFGDEGHILVTGGSGSGKTSSVLIPSLQKMSEEQCCYCIDVAGDITQNVKINNNTRILDFRSDNSSNFNIFFEIDNACSIEEKEAKLIELAELMIVIDNSNSTEKYYTQCAQSILKASLLAFYDRFKSDDDICNIFDFIIARGWKALFTEIDRSNSETAKKIISEFANNDKLNAESFATTKRNIDIYLYDVKLREHLKRSNAFSASNINDSQIYVVIQESEIEHYSTFLKLITAQILNVIRKRENLINKTTLLVLDELASYGSDIKEQLLDALQRSRKKNCRIMLAVQSMSDLHTVFNNQYDVQSALNNCEYTLIMSCNSVEEAENCQKLIGEYISFRKSYTKSANATSMTKSEQTEKAVTITELRALKAKKKLILIHSQGYYKLYKCFYYEN